MANNKGYKRSWKNYLLDRNFQLRFTFTMLAIAVGLMVPLGWWVSDESARATEVAVNKIDGIKCPELLTNKDSSATPTPGQSLPGGEETDLLQEPGPEVDDSKDDWQAGDEQALGSETGDEEVLDNETDDELSGDVEALGNETDDQLAGDDEALDSLEGSSAETEGGERKRRHIEVTIDDSRMPDPVVVVGEVEEVPATPEQIAKSKEDRDACLAKVAARKLSVQQRENLITKVMIGSAVFLLVILLLYGIKTTHRVAGPLHKVGLYLGKLENNVYDTVYNLRKGDQLVEFYDHFNGAHQGLTKLQEEDRDRLRDAIALAKEAGLADKDPELAELIPELERLLAEKEESFVKKQA